MTITILKKKERKKERKNSGLDCRYCMYMSILAVSSSFTSVGKSLENTSLRRRLNACLVFSLH
jgi:hypothetical protein